MKDTVRRWRPATDGEETFPKHSETEYMQNEKLNKRKQLENGQKTMCRHFSIDDTWIANKHIKICSTSLTNKKCEVRPQWAMVYKSTNS